MKEITSWLCKKNTIPCVTDVYPLLLNFVLWICWSQICHSCPQCPASCVCSGHAHPVLWCPCSSCVSSCLSTLQGGAVRDALLHTLPSACGVYSIYAIRVLPELFSCLFSFTYVAFVSFILARLSACKQFERKAKEKAWISHFSS